MCIRDRFFTFLRVAVSLRVMRLCKAETFAWSADKLGSTLVTLVLVLEFLFLTVVLGFADFADVLAVLALATALKRVRSFIGLALTREDLVVRALFATGFLDAVLAGVIFVALRGFTERLAASFVVLTDIFFVGVVIIPQNLSLIHISEPTRPY